MTPTMPEHIGSILQRVLKDLETKYQEMHGARPLAPCGGDALTITSGAPSLSGGDDGSDQRTN